LDGNVKFVLGESDETFTHYDTRRQRGRYSRNTQTRFCYMIRTLVLMDRADVESLRTPLKLLLDIIPDLRKEFDHDGWVRGTEGIMDRYRRNIDDCTRSKLSARVRRRQTSNNGSQDIG
jgi:hypothetical protein